MFNEDQKREIQSMIDYATRYTYNKRVGDTPNDALQLTPQKYVNMNGVIASRPPSVIAAVGQQYFATNLGYPVFFNTTNQWVTAAGSVIASN